MPSADRDCPQLAAARGVLVLSKRKSASQRGLIAGQDLRRGWINETKKSNSQPQLRIGATVPLTNEVGVINATWGQRH
jgi:hypothetical protein